MQEYTGYYNPLQQTAPETGQIIDAETGNVIGHADCGDVSEEDTRKIIELARRGFMYCGECPIAEKDCETDEEWGSWEEVFWCKFTEAYHENMECQYLKELT